MRQSGRPVHVSYIMRAALAFGGIMPVYRRESWKPIERKVIRIAKVAVHKSAEEFETGNPVKTLRHLRDSDDGNWLVEIYFRQAYWDQVNWKRARIGAPELYVTHQNPAAAQTRWFIQDELKE